MATRKPSQAQQNPPTNPFAAIPGLEIWRSMFDSQNERFEQMLVEMERLEKERHERAMRGLDDVTQLMKSSLEYQSQLSTQFRTLGLDAARRGVAMMNPEKA